jgi:hypothetical protein
MVELQTTRPADVAEMARRFRLRAAETEDAAYRELMLRTAGELDALASRLSVEKSD